MTGTWADPMTYTGGGSYDMYRADHMTDTGWII